MKLSTLSVERSSTQYAISLTIPWRTLQAQSSAMCQNAEPSIRKYASHIFSGYPNFAIGLQTDAVLRVSQEGLQDRQKVEVRLTSRLPCLTLPPVCFCYRSGTRRFALLYPVSPLPINTTSKFSSLSFPPDHTGYTKLHIRAHSECWAIKLNQQR